MKNIYDTANREELINRIKNLNENSQAQWGKMTIWQVLRHCTLWEEMILGRTTYKRAFIGRLIGKILLKNEVKDDNLMRRNTPTIPELKISGNGNIETEKIRWISLIQEHAQYSNPNLVHPFFGHMTKEQIGIHAYKHTDHHLRQFGC